MIKGSSNVAECWDALEARILAEERAEVLIGGRDLNLQQAAKKEWWRELFSLEDFGAASSVTGAAVFAVFLGVIVMGPGQSLMNQFFVPGGEKFASSLGGATEEAGIFEGSELREGEA